MTLRAAFSLIEIVVVLAVGSLVAATLLTLLRSQAAVARSQSERASLQQSARIGRHEIARFGRMAGRGGLPRRLAVSVRSNVGSGERLAGPGSPALVPGSDVLTVRGVLQGPLLRAAAVAEELEGGSVTLRAGDGGAASELGRLLDAASDGPGEALLLSDGSGSRCAIVELVGARDVRRTRSGRLEKLVLEWRSAGSPLAESYRALGAACAPGSPGLIGRVGLLEEHRFYLRRGAETVGPAPNHRLARARFLPGTDRAHRSSTAAGAALLDHVLDFQVALGVDLNGDGALSEGTGGGRAADEWLFNEPGEPIPAASVAALRATLLLRARRPGERCRALAIDGIEDRVFREGPAGPSRELELFRCLEATALIRVRG